MRSLIDKMIKNLDGKIIYWQDGGAIARIREALDKEVLCVTSTDTIFGFLSVTEKRGFDVLQQLKGERKNKPFLVLIGSVFKLKHFVDLNSMPENLIKLLHHCWPGPVTIVFRAHKDIPSFLMSEQGTIALRCPAHQGLQKLLQSFNGLFSTSANKTGQPFPVCPEELDDDIVSNVEYVVLDRDGHEQDTKLPSTILDCSNIAQQGIKVLREGAYPIHLLEDYYGSKFNS